MNDANPSIFRGVVALELRDGTPPQRAALGVAAAGDLAALLGRDLAALVPGVRDCDLALMAAHFDPAEALRVVVERTIARGGVLVIPAFAVGRAQELLYYFWKLKRAGHLGEIPLFLDSPMAIEATGLMSRHLPDHRLDAKTCGDVFSIARCTGDVEASKAISANRFPKIVITASGMATGGRVLHHLKAFAPDQRNTILLAGFQAAGTRGRSLQDGAKELKIHGVWIPVNAEVVHFDMLSAHADAGELMLWLSGCPHPPRKIFIVHGEPEASEALRVRIERELGWTSVVPRLDQEFSL